MADDRFRRHAIGCTIGGGVTILGGILLSVIDKKGVHIEREGLETMLLYGPFIFGGIYGACVAPSLFSTNVNTPSVGPATPAPAVAPGPAATNPSKIERAVSYFGKSLAGFAIGSLFTGSLTAAGYAIGTIAADFR